MQLKLIMSIAGRPKRLFIFVNPFGGKKAATKIFLNQVKPLLDDAEIQITLQGSYLFINLVHLFLLFIHSEIVSLYAY